MSATDDTNAARRGSGSNDLLGPAVPDNVMAYLHAYGDSRADEDGRSGLRIAEAILALRRWAAELQAAERERIALKLRGMDCAHVCGIGEELAALVRGA